MVSKPLKLREGKALFFVGVTAALEDWAANRNSPQKWVWRARIVLMWARRRRHRGWADGLSLADRSILRGIEGLKRDASRPARKKPLSAEVIEAHRDMTLHQKSLAGTHWSVRKLAEVVAISPSTVQRSWFP
jgi:hypothetical protein